MQPPAVAVLGAWHLLVWATRVRNVLADASLSGGDKAGQAGVAALFVLGGVALVALAATDRARSQPLVVRVLAVAGAAYWLVRTPFIATNDHPAGFIAVHVVLALVTAALSAWAFVSVPRHRAQ